MLHKTQFFSEKDGKKKPVRLKNTSGVFGAPAIYYALFISILLFNIARGFFYIYNDSFNPDEFQHMHIVWNIVQNKIIYKDFFEHHGPLFPILTSIIYKSFHYQPVFETLYLLRLNSFILVILILLLTFYITHALTKSVLWGLFSAALLSSTYFFISRGIQIRPDSLQSVFFLCGVYSFLKFLERKNTTPLFYSGVFLACSILTSAKAGFGLAGVVIFLIVNPLLKEGLMKYGKIYFIFLAGLIVPFSMALAYFYYHGALTPYLYYNFCFNFWGLSHRKSLTTFRLMTTITEGQFCIFIIILAGIIALVYSLGYLRALRRYDERLLFIALMVFTTSIMVIIILYAQTVISVSPMACIGSTYGFYSISIYKEKLLSHKMRKTIQSLGAVALLSTSLNNLLIIRDIPDSVSDQRALTNYILEATPRSEPIQFFWNGCGGYMFNEDTQFYWTNVGNFQRIFNKNEQYEVFGSHLIDTLEREHVRYVVASENNIDDLPALPLTLRAYLYQNFQPTQFGCLLQRKNND